LLCGASLLALTIGFVWRQPWALNLWPWELSRLSAIFLGSITIAYGVALVWIALSRELRALAGLSVGLAVTFGGMAAFAISFASSDALTLSIRLFAVVTATLTAASVMVYFWSRRIEFREPRTIPRSALVPMAIIALIVAAEGCALALRVPNVFPWRLTSELSTTYGWIFLGAASYFLYAFAHPSWGNAYGQLMGFLAYAIVLFGPFILHLKTVPAELRVQLIVYLSVLTFGTVSALYFLFANKSSRLRSIPEPARNQRAPIL
jgi:hypothetical protein